MAQKFILSKGKNLLSWNLVLMKSRITAQTFGRNRPVATYAIVQVDVENAEEYGKYAALAGPAVTKYGGEFLARGGEVAVMEGVTRDRCVIIKFTDMDTAKSFYHGPEYQEALKFALPVSTRDYKFVEGV
jgi:uncharacterized protein (DUF1330 family)